MATATDHSFAGARPSRDQAFFTRMALTLVGVIVFAFAQWSARMWSVTGPAPIWVHVHGLSMLGWLGLFATQSVLAGRGAIALHRRLGMASAALVAFIVVSGVFTGIKALEVGRVPPFFPPAYFLALVCVGVVAFGGMVTAGIALRRDMQWHRRMMLGATIAVLEPALGRLLPMPLLGAAGPWAEMAVQLGVVALVMRHDRHTLGVVHPATRVLFAAIAGVYVAIHLLVVFPPWVALAQAIAAG